MHTRALKCFIKVYETCNIAAAAQDLYISPQGLSKTIKQLEYDLETALFTRVYQGMKPTEAGHILYARALRVCQLSDHLRTEISVLDGTRKSLQIAVTYSTAHVISYEHIYNFGRSHGELEIRLDEYPDEYPIEQTFAEEIDAGIVLGHEGMMNCSYELLGDCEYVFAVEPDDPLVPLADTESTIPLEILGDREIVLKPVERGREHPLLSVFRKHNIHAKIAYSSGNLDARLASVRKKQCIAQCLDIAGPVIAAHDLRMIRIANPPCEQMYLICNDRTGRNSVVRNFLDHVRSEIRLPSNTVAVAPV